MELGSAMHTKQLLGCLHELLEQRGSHMRPWAVSATPEQPTTFVSTSRIRMLHLSGEQSACYPLLSYMLYYHLHRSNYE